MIARQIKQMLQAKNYQEQKKPQSFITSTLRIPKFMGKERIFYQNLQKFNSNELDKLHQKLTNTDYNLKYGKLKDSIVLQKLVLDICANQLETRK